MCKWNKWGDTRIDPCMKKVIVNLDLLGIKTLACCCGHGKYPMSIVVKNLLGFPLEIFSNKIIPRSIKFYKRDKQGHYYIPECMSQVKK